MNIWIHSIFAFRYLNLYNFVGQHCSASWWIYGYHNPACGACHMNNAYALSLLILSNVLQFPPLVAHPGIVGSIVWHCYCPSPMCDLSTAIFLFNRVRSTFQHFQILTMGKVQTVLLMRQAICDRLIVWFEISANKWCIYFQPWGNPCS